MGGMRNTVLHERYFLRVRLMSVVVKLDCTIAMAMEEGQVGNNPQLPPASEPWAMRELAGGNAATTTAAREVIDIACMASRDAKIAATERRIRPCRSGAQLRVGSSRDCGSRRASPDGTWGP